MRLDQVELHDSRQPRVELRERHGLQDQTMRHLMEILLYEKRQGFQSGAFFLDGVAAALASHLIRWYSADAPVMTNAVDAKRLPWVVVIVNSQKRTPPKTVMGVLLYCCCA